MNDSGSPIATGRKLPDAVVGPITLGLQHSGGSFILEPDTVIGPFTVNSDLGSADIGVTDASSSVDAGVVVNLSLGLSLDRSPQTITFTGETTDQPDVPFAPGSTLYAVALIDSNLVLLTTDGTVQTYTSFPIGSGPVTATLAI